MKYIKFFKEIRSTDVGSVGGKNASLGQMISQLTSAGIKIPDGFAITADAYWYFLNKNNILEKIKLILEKTNYKDFAQLKEGSQKIRQTIEEQPIPEDLEKEIVSSYDCLSREYKSENINVAVRSSATAEDLPTASFAGQQETFLNISGTKQLIESYKKCLSSLFTQRAITYRIEKGFDHFQVALSVGIQKMVNSDTGSAGVMFTLDTESGFKDVILINSSWGLGESVVQGSVDPDTFYVHKPTLEQGFRPILKKELGNKQTKIIYSNTSQETTITVPVTLEQRNKFSLNNNDIIQLAEYGLIIEHHYSKLNNKWTPMDIEWAKDGQDGKIYIVQARYETVHAQDKKENIITQYYLQNNINKKVMLTGQSIGQKIVSGIARVIKSPNDINQVLEGDILITTMTDPDWVPIMKKAAGIITEKGGRTCHAAIVSRELGIPAIIGAQNATDIIKTGTEITLDCSDGEIGKIYAGKLSFEVKKIEVKSLKKLPVDIMLNTGSPDKAFTQSFLPVDGVGLARTEFIIAGTIKIHPNALINFDQVTDPKVRKQIEEITSPYFDPDNKDYKKDFFVDSLAQEAGTIAAAFYPRPVIIRLSDFKSNEYRNLIGGSYFEPEEENPMIGLRGASRYYNDLYKDAFELECMALHKIRNIMGLTNVKIMIPFVRTTQEAQKVLEIMKKFDLERNKNNLEIIMMCEVPSNVILIDEFSNYFDGFSIGSNDLTQLTLAIDRDSKLLASIFDERNEAVKKMILLAIQGARKNNKHIGICGEAPSDYPDFADFLIKAGINSISLNSDTVLNFLQS